MNFSNCCTTVVPSVLLAGERVSCDHTLKQRLGKYCEVTAVNQLNLGKRVSEWKNLDLAVLELSSSDESELENIQFLKKNQPLILILVIEGSGATDVVVKAFQLGAKDFFRKPYDSDLLGDRIEGLLRKRFFIPELGE